MASFTFGKERRLLTAKEYQAVFEHSSLKVSNKYILFLARPNGLKHSRLGLVIAKKNIRYAVQRNRIKRLIRESFRHHQFKPLSIDAVVLARRGLDKLDNKSVNQQLVELWQRLDTKCAKKARQTDTTLNSTP